MVESAAPLDAKTFEALNMLQSVTTQGAYYVNAKAAMFLMDTRMILVVCRCRIPILLLLLQRVNMGAIHVIEAANDADALVTGGCKIATPTGVVGVKVRPIRELA